MRILHVPHNYLPFYGGTELLCQKVSEKLSNKGHYVRVLTGNVNIGGYYRFGERRVRSGTEIINGVEVKRLLFGGFLYAHSDWIRRIPKVRNYFSVDMISYMRREFAKNIHKEISEFRPEVVMTMPHLCFNVECVLRSHQIKRFPLVMVPLLHEEDPEWSTQRVAYSLKEASAVIATTDYEADRLEHVYGVAAERIYTACLGVDLPPATNDEIRQRKVLFLGRKDLCKGISDLLDAMKEVWKLYPDSELILAGAPTSSAPIIDRLIADLPENQRSLVRSMDNISEADKTCLLNAATCLVLPSRAESFGIVILEAWAHKTPIITLDLPVFRSIVTPGKDGLLIAPGNIQALARAIILLLQNQSLAADMGRAGRLKVEQRYNWDAVASSYLEAYQYAKATN